MMARRPAVLVVALVAWIGAGCGEDGGSDAEGDGRALVGLFSIAAGECGKTGVTGSSFRMVQPGGTVAGGPFVTNGDSPCPDKTWTPLLPGDDGGLRTGVHQPQPAPPFDARGNAMSALITKPQRWFAVAFGLATNEHDPQTDTDAPPPRIVADGERLTGDIAAFAATWNGQHFNQGAPKPDGSLPGETKAPTGTYEKATGAYTLEWTSQIVGGPFNNFTGVWHLEGVFQEEDPT